MFKKRRSKSKVVQQPEPVAEVQRLSPRTLSIAVAASCPPSRSNSGGTPLSAEELLASMQKLNPAFDDGSDDSDDSGDSGDSGDGDGHHAPHDQQPPQNAVSWPLVAPDGDAAAAAAALRRQMQQPAASGADRDESDEEDEQQQFQVVDVAERRRRMEQQAPAASWAPGPGGGVWMSSKGALASSAGPVTSTKDIRFVPKPRPQSIAGTPQSVDAGVSPSTSSLARRQTARSRFAPQQTAEAQQVVESGPVQNNFWKVNMTVPTTQPRTKPVVKVEEEQEIVKRMSALKRVTVDQWQPSSSQEKVDDVDGNFWKRNMTLSKTRPEPLPLTQADSHEQDEITKGRQLLRRAQEEVKEEEGEAAPLPPTAVWQGQRKVGRVPQVAPVTTDTGISDPFAGIKLRQAPKIEHQPPQAQAPLADDAELEDMPVWKRLQLFQQRQQTAA